MSKFGISKIVFFLAVAVLVPTRLLGVVADESGEKPTLQDNGKGPSAAKPKGEPPAPPGKSPAAAKYESKFGKPAPSSLTEGHSSVTPTGEWKDYSQAIDGQNAAASNLIRDPFNLQNRQALTNAINNTRQRESAVAERIIQSGTLSANEVRALGAIATGLVDQKLGRSDNSGENNNQPTVSPQRIQQALERVQQARQFYNADPPAALDAIRNLDEYKLFTDSGDEIPVLVDNTEVGLADAGPVQTAPGLEDKFAAIANGQPSTAVYINKNIVSPAAGNLTAGEEAVTEQISAEETKPEAAPQVAATGRGPASEEDGGLTVEDVLKALLGEEALEEEEAGIEVGYDEGLVEDEYFEEHLGKEIPLVLRPGKLRALQRGLSGKIDKSLPIGTRTGNGLRDDDDLLMVAGEKFPVLKGIFQKARRSPTATQLLFWLSIAVSLYFMMKLFYNLTQRPQPSYANSSYFAAARDHQDDGLAEDLEISFTEPQPVQVNRAMAQRFGNIPMVQVDPELGQLREDGEIQSGSFEVIEHTAQSLTMMKTITQEVTGTLAPWTPKDARILEPNKIYIKMDPKSEKWYLVRGGADGKIGETLAEIFPGTVVDGETLGPQFTAVRYRLKHNGKWAPTADRVQFVVSVMPKGSGPSWWS